MGGFRKFLWWEWERVLKKRSPQPQCINVAKGIEKDIKGKEGERKNET